MMKKLFPLSPVKTLFLCAALLLFVNLGVDSISNSEGRWFAVAQEMLSSGDYLHPSINGQPYFDKPLVSYWFIALAAQFTGGVNGWSARLPSAIAALIALFCTVRIGRQLFGEKAALLSGWVFVTVYSFTFWGRLAEADMEQVAFIMAALAVYFSVREKPGFWGYAAFWSICAAGAQTKGLAAFALPALSAGIDMLLSRKLLRHLNIRSIGGLAAGLLVYLAPFVLESCLRGAGGASGLMLVFRENIVRIVNPWDHCEDPWWVYFQYLPQLMLPWTPLLLWTLIGYFRKIFQHELCQEEKWLLLTIGAFFLLFSASRSRRLYYILPLVPFCSMLCGACLADVKDELMNRYIHRLLRLMEYLFLAAGLLALPAAVCAIIAERFGERISGLPAGVIPGLLPAFLFVFAAGAVMTLYWQQQRSGKIRWSFHSSFPELDRLIPLIYIALFTIFALLIPPLDSDPALRTTRYFCKSVHAEIQNRGIPAENLAFFGRHYRNHVYYLALPQPAKLFGPQKIDDSTRRFTDDSTQCGGPEELAEFLVTARAEGGMLMLRRDSLAFLQKEHPKLARAIAAAPAQQLEEQPSVMDEWVLSRIGNPEKKQKKMRKILEKKMIVFFYPSAKQSQQQEK